MEPDYGTEQTGKDINGNDISNTFQGLAKSSDTERADILTAIYMANGDVELLDCLTQKADIVPEICKQQRVTSRTQ